MKEIFKIYRIKFTEMLNDTYSYLTDVYQQADQAFDIADPYGQILFVTNKIAELIFYYIEDSITELNIHTATRRTSIQGLAALAGHNPSRGMSATGTIKIYPALSHDPVYNNTIIVPNYSIIKNSANGLKYFVHLPQDSIKINLNAPTVGITAKITQGEFEAQQFTGNGEPLQSFQVNVTPGRNIDNHLVYVYVNGTLYEKYDALYDIPKDYAGCLIKTGIQSGINVIFGNGSFGAIPPLGAIIRIEYVINEGEAGNIFNTDDTIFVFDDNGYDMLGGEWDLKTNLNITSEETVNFGTAQEPLELTKLLAPHQSRSFVLANADNYIHFFRKFNYFSVVDAFSTFEDGFIDDDNIIYLLLVPDISKRLLDSENYFDVNQDLFLLLDEEKDKIYKLLDDTKSKIASTVVKLLEPQVKRYVMNVYLTTFTDTREEWIKDEIYQKASEYFLNMYRRDRIPGSDLVAIFENIAGIDSVRVDFISEDNELAHLNDEDANDVGVDEFGIIIGKDELPLVRGGWSDRYGNYYEDGLDANKLCSVNVFVKQTVKRSTNIRLNAKHIDKLRNNG